MSPYAYCANNPVLNIDPAGEDYWSTNDPYQIMSFINAWGSGATQFDFSSGWNHATDAEFADQLSYNDETGKFHISYGTVENGEVVINARSFDANLTPVSFSGEGYSGAFVYQRRTGFLGFIESINRSLNPYNFNSYNDGTNTWSVNASGRIIGIPPLTLTIGYPPAVGKGGNLFIKGFGNISKDVFHKTVKGNILTKAVQGKFEKVVGTNPDITVVNGKIVLQGSKNSPFHGKTYKTDLNANDFLK
jgi:hypothetical protein